MSTFKLHNASKKFGGRTIINDVSFELNTGDIVGLFGRNGSGKSTLLKMMYGTLRSGKVEMSFNAEPISPSEIIPRKIIGYVPQSSFLPKNVRVRDIIPVYFPKGEDQDKVFYDAVITTIANKKIGELSHGQRKYFEVVLTALLPHPFVFLDEPFSMLEPLHKNELKEFFRKLAVRKGILMTDHYYEDVLDCATSSLVIKDGVSYPADSKEDLKEFEYISKNR
ncbi:ABC transporter ATP-binding protein [Aureitalea sp. L0-47]|uniref:ATP-binding cassette domain-containing protein n=1 Tax=Aureitalea sp. L0-47 TaxID=2816962 RepID=UPI0022375EB5|nr:ABC transporter ATP-binding protein [Aureitalea sp. L0-47]MCW5519751.1 ABC transporter ATP-binding protein [Aureitalea sp. L0-47]